MSPRNRDLLRPVELVGGAAIASLFVGIIVFAATRVWLTTGITFGVTFVIVIVGLAMLQLVARPPQSTTEAEDAATPDAPDAPNHSPNPEATPRAEDA